MLVDFFRILAHAQRDLQLDAATRTLDGTGKVVASTAFALTWNRVEENPSEASEWCKIGS